MAETSEKTEIAEAEFLGSCSYRNRLSFVRIDISSQFHVST